MARKASRLTEPATCSLDGSYRLSFWRPFVSKSATSPQRRFNDGGYWDRMKAGECTEEIRETHPDTRYPEVIARHPGAVSVTAWYRDRMGTMIVEVHYFRMPDGSVIPGKRPDPKLLFEDGVLYHQEKLKARLKRLAQEEADHLKAEPCGDVAE